MAGRGLPLQTDPAISRIPMLSGAGVELQAQAQLFNRVADLAGEIGQDYKKLGLQDAEKKARADFAASEDQTPDGEMVPTDRRDGIFGMTSSLDRAYNNMLEALTLDRAKRDVADVATEQRGKNFGNVEGFNKAMEGWRKGYLSKAPIETMGDLESLLNGEIQAGSHAVLNDRVDADLKEARTAMDAGIEDLASKTETLLREGIGAMDSAPVQALTSQLRDRLDIKANNPLYGYSDEERALDSTAMADRLMAASLVPEVRKVFDATGFADALDAADALAAGLGRDDAATSNIRQRLRAEANLMNQNLNARQEGEREAARLQAARDKETGTALDQEATRTIYNPKATMEQRIAAVNTAAPYITGDRYGTLYRLAVKGPSGEDGDSGGLFPRLMMLARKGELTEEEALDQGVGLNDVRMNQLLEEVNSKQDKDLTGGMKLLEGAFARSPFSLADFGPLAAAEAEGKEDLRRWRASNPDADANDIAVQAREIMARRGRVAAVAMMSEVNAQSGDFEAPTSDKLSVRMDELATQMAKLPAGASQREDLKRQYQQLKEVKRLLDTVNGPD